MIRAGEHGEGEALALAESRTIIGWSELGPLTPEMTRDQLKERIQATYGENRTACLAQQPVSCTALFTTSRLGTWLLFRSLEPRARCGGMDYRRLPAYG